MMIMMTTSTDGALGVDDIAALEREVVALTVIGRFCLALACFLRELEWFGAFCVHIPNDGSE